MNKGLSLLVLSSLLAFPCLAQEDAAERKVETQKAKGEVMMNVESAQIVITGEGEDQILKLRATLKNVSDKPLMLELSGSQLPPRDGRPVHDLHGTAFTFYDRFLGEGVENDTWLIRKVPGSYLAGPLQELAAGESIEIEEPLIYGKDFTKGRRVSYKTDGIRFSIHAAVTGEEKSGVIVEGNCKWVDPK